MALRSACRGLAQRLTGGSALALRDTGCATIAGALQRTFAKVAGDCKYLPSHEWAKIEGNVATVGISDFAQSELGDVVYVELPELGSQVKKSENFGVVESVKAASDVYSPVSGEVIEVNSSLTDEPGKVNADSFGAGWMIKVKMSNAGEASDLLDAKAYEKHCEDH